MGRSPSCSSCSKHEEGLSRGAWTGSEDKILSEYIKSYGVGRWRSLPKKAGLNRSGKSCRLRWLNYLRTDIKRGNISPEEEDLLIRLHRLLGNRWALIAGRLPGRTDNEIKNYWNTHMSKKVQLGDLKSKFHNPLKRRDVPSYSNNDEEGVVVTDIYTFQNTPVNTTAVRYSGRAVTDDNIPDIHDGINEKEGLKATDDHVVEIDTSKSWRQLLLEDCMGDYQYDRWEGMNRLQQNSIVSTINGTDDHHKSNCPSLSQSIILKENHSSSACDLFDQDSPHSKNFSSSYFDSFLELGEPSYLLP